MNVRKLLFGDLGVKLIAIVIAWAIWFLVREGLEESGERTLPVQLAAPEKYGAEVVRGFGSVRVKFKGSRGAVTQYDNLPESDRVVRVQVLPDHIPVDAKATTKIFRYDDDLNVLFPELIRTGELRPDSIEPEGGIEVRIWYIDTATKPVAPPELEDIGDPEVQVAFERLHDPEVTLRARRETMVNIPSLKTRVTAEAILREVERLGAKPSDIVDVELEIAMNEEFEILAPVGRLEASIRITRVSTDTLEVPIRIYYKTADQPRMAFDSKNEIARKDVFLPAEGDGDPHLRVSLRGAPGVLKDLDAGAIRAFVLASDWNVENPSEPVKVRFERLPEGVELDAYTLYLTRTQ